MNKKGYTLINERELAEVRGIARLWRHDQCGAQVLSICNDDENKCFGVSFFTPPDNSTGVAHILEHSVLCGSSRYPVKEPFVELLKGSLQTFLNAFTFPDKTCYPVASANLRDFHNLINVYLDAVFHPLLTEDIFKQEGWHIEADSMDQPWSFKGVVYNEMKGVYSSADSILAEQSQQAVFPDNLYCLDSGGNPEKIPDLTYQAFKDFHARYYQPGNARFFFWGDDPEDDRFGLLAPYLDGHVPVGVLPEVKLQRPFTKPRFVEKPYAASEGDSRALFTVNWLLGERGNTALSMKMEMLEHILEGMPGSPLRRALIESGLGEDATGCGLETDLRQMYYSTGLKGIEPANVGKAENLILSTLEKLAKGLDQDAINAAINTVEFAYRENNSGRFPRGLTAMIQSLSTWLYGGDPLAPLAWEEPLNKIKEAARNGEKIFEQAINDYFLTNSHRVRVTLLPDTKLAHARETRETAILGAIQEEQSPADRENLVRDTKRLREAQSKPDNPDDLAKIPSLGMKDLPLKNAAIPCSISRLPQVFIGHDLPTNGIAYTNLLLPLRRIPDRLVSLLPLFARSLVEWGTVKEDYTRLGARIASVTGGFGASILPGTRLDGGTYCYVAVGAKSVYSNLEELFDLYHKVLLQPQNDRGIMIERLTQMLLEEKARLEYTLQAAGHMATSLRIRARYRGEGALSEQTGGISQLRFLSSMLERLQKDPAGLLSDFEELRALVTSGKDAIFDCAADKTAINQVQDQAAQLMKALPGQPLLDTGQSTDTWAAMTNLPPAEAFITQGQINYVAKGANLYDLGYVYKGSAAVIMRWLRMGRLWEEVRVAGGAYGAFCVLDRFGGTCVFSSYRDPNIDRTLSVYDGLAPYLRDFSPTREQLTQAIIGAVGDVDAYLLPDAKAAKSLAWYLTGLDEETRQKNRDEMLGTTGKDFNDFADVLAAASENGTICVIGGNSANQAATEHGWHIEPLITTQ